MIKSRRYNSNELIKRIESRKIEYKPIFCDIITINDVEPLINNMRIDFSTKYSNNSTKNHLNHDHVIKIYDTKNETTNNNTLPNSIKRLVRDKQNKINLNDCNKYKVIEVTDEELKNIVIPQDTIKYINIFNILNIYNKLYVDRSINYNNISQLFIFIDIKFNVQLYDIDSIRCNDEELRKTIKLMNNDKFMNIAKTIQIVEDFDEKYSKLYDDLSNEEQEIINFDNNIMQSSYRLSGNKKYTTNRSINVYNTNKTNVNNKLSKLKECYKSNHDNVYPYKNENTDINTQDNVYNYHKIYNNKYYCNNNYNDENDINYENELNNENICNDENELNENIDLRKLVQPICNIIEEFNENKYNNINNARVIFNTLNKSNNSYNIPKTNNTNKDNNITLAVNFICNLLFYDTLVKDSYCFREIDTNRLENFDELLSEKIYDIDELNYLVKNINMLQSKLINLSNMGYRITNQLYSFPYHSNKEVHKTIKYLFDQFDDNNYKLTKKYKINRLYINILLFLLFICSCYLSYILINY